MDKHEWIMVQWGNGHTIDFTTPIRIDSRGLSEAELNDRVGRTLLVNTPQFVVRDYDGRWLQIFIHKDLLE